MKKTEVKRYEKNLEQISESCSSKKNAGAVAGDVNRAKLLHSGFELSVKLKCCQKTDR